MGKKNHMLGILILIAVYVWFLLGDRFSALVKIIFAPRLSTAMYYLQTQGADRDQIIEILLTFPR